MMCRSLLPIQNPKSKIQNNHWRCSSAVERGSHKPLVGSSNLPAATIFDLGFGNSDLGFQDLRDHIAKNSNPNSEIPNPKSLLAGNSDGQSAGLLSRRSRVRVPPCQPIFCFESRLLGGPRSRLKAGLKTQRMPLELHRSRVRVSSRRKSCSSVGRAGFNKHWSLHFQLSGECREDYIRLAPRGVGNTGDPKLFTCKCLFNFVTRFFFLQEE